MSSFELPTLADGSPNPKYIDLLTEDEPLSGQKFCCMSFVSPENILKDKNIFMFEKFLKVWDFTKSAEKYKQFLHFISMKYSLNFDNLSADLEEFCKEEKSFLKDAAIEDDYKTFLDNNEENLQKQFDQTHEFQTSVRSVKFRGSYSTQEEAEMRCKMLRDKDPNHNIYIGPVGVWMPWEPEAYKTGKVEYLEPELNQLMKEKNKNDKRDKEKFRKRVAESKQTAIEDNMKKAKQSGNKLSQNIDEEGNLFKLTSNSNDVHAVADIKKELFDQENVPTTNLSAEDEAEVQNTIIEEVTEEQ